jgi:hypothetical protein
MKVLRNEDQSLPDKQTGQLLLLIEKLSLEQLYDINEIVIDRIKFLEKIEDLKAVSAFRRGDKVSWEHNGQAYSGSVLKVNQKTVSVAEKDPPYKRWKISPQFLKKSSN